MKTTPLRSALIQRLRRKAHARSRGQNLVEYGLVAAVVVLM